MNYPTLPNPSPTGNNSDDIKNILVYLQILSQTQVLEVLTGTMILWPNTVVPNGAPSPLAPYLKLGGSTINVSRTSFSALFTLLGTRFGAGDGSTTFGLPTAPSTVTGCIWLIHI